MDIFFQDPNEIPLPPQEVRIRQLKAEPWNDGRRVQIYLEVDPFQKRPSAEVTILNEQGEEVAAVSVIESMQRKMEFNMHLREPQPGGEYRVQAILFFSDPIPQPKEGEEVSLDLPEPLKVDQKEITFHIPSS